MQVFISHAQADEPLVGNISTVLKEAGLEVWEANSCLMPGDNLGHEVARALEESQAMVVLLTPEALHSPWVKWEIECALSGTRYRNRLIPVLVGDPQQLPEDDIPWILRRLPQFTVSEHGNNETEIKPIADAILSHA